MMEKGASSTQASSGTKLAATAMAIAGRALRPCDVCGRERAKWYCKADEAYLCEHCDGSVHGANAVSLRHERVRLGPNGMIMKNVRRLTKPEPADEKDISGPGTTNSTSNDRYVGFRKKPRSSRPHPTLSSSKETAKAVKAEPTSPKENSPDLDVKEVHEEMSRQVPVFNEDLATSDDNSLGFSVPCAVPSNDDDEDMCFTLSASCDLESFLDGDADLCDMDGLMSGTLTMEDIGELEGVIASPESKVFTNESFGIDFPEMTFRSSNDASEVEGGCDTPDGAMSDFCARVKVEETDELDKIKLEVDEMLGFAFNACAVKEEEVERKITLKLNYEDVLNAWSDRGPFWTEGPRPQSVPDDSTFDPASALDSGLGPEYCMESTQAETLGQVPVVNFGDERMIAARGGREARVMRYREKRRTRLFSKKIRYEVRKLNAERRPRLKGRFVKRTTCN